MLKRRSAGEPGARSTLCTGIGVRASHSQSHQIKRVMIVSQSFRTIIRSVCCLQGKPGVVLEAEFTFRERAPNNAVSAASPTSCRFALVGERTEAQKHPEPWDCETGQEIGLFCRINS